VTWEPLRTVLRDLRATGVRGFEGFVAEALTEITGQPFRLLKPGPQGGLDGMADEGSSGLVVGFEAKHYGTRTVLSLGALKAKVGEAAESVHDLDLWVLATTRAVDAGDMRQLVAHGHQRGIEVLVLDWGDPVAIPPALALMCAMAPTVFAKWFPGATDALRALSDLLAYDLFNPSSADLRRRLTSPRVGYAFAQRQMHRWIREQMTSVPSARYAFDSYANLQDVSVGTVVARKSLNVSLNRWWKSESFAAVLTGQEGTGKTWAALAWWLSASEAADFPLTVIIPARDVTITNGPMVVAAALHRALKLQSSDFWVHRLERWMGGSIPRPRLLVVVDGLNQNWQFNGWTDWLRSLQISPWAGQTRVLFTCRPDHWYQQLRELPGLVTPVVTIPVSGFGDNELDELLLGYGLERSDFQPSLIELIRVPRLCRIALELRDRLNEAGDVTRERLVFEDWRHRTEGATGLMSEEEFRAFITRLGSNLQAANLAAPITRKELLRRLGEDSGDGEERLRGVLSEVIDGLWMEPAGKPHQFKLRHDMLPHVLALSLVSELREADDPLGATERLAVRLEPYQSLDIVVSVLRCAASISLFDPKCSSQVRGALLLRWLESQNFSSVDFEEFWRVLACDVSTSLDVIDTLWFKDIHHRVDEVLVKALANAVRWPDVLEGVENALTKWFRRYWPDPMDGEFTGPPREDERAHARRANTCARAAIWSNQVPEDAFGWELNEVSGKGEPWGASRAAALMSFLPRAPMIRPLTAWAVSHAVMQSARQRDALRWVLRWNRHDAADAESVVLEAADRLLKTSNHVGMYAARVLLEAIGSPEAMRRVAELPPLPVVEGLVGWRDTVSLGSDGVVNWKFAEAKQWPRCRMAPLDATMGLDEYAVNPSASLSAEGLAALHAIADDVTDSMLRGKEPNASHDNGGLDTAQLALSRWAPGLRAQLERRQWAALRSDSDDGESPPRSRRRSPDVAPRFLVMDDAEVSAWRRVAELQLTDAPATDESNALDLYLHGALLAGLPAREQIEALRRQPGFPSVLKRYEELLATPLLEDFGSLTDAIIASSDASVRAWLQYLAHVDLRQMPKGWSTLRILLTHEDDSIRALAVEVAWNAQDAILATMFASSGWRVDDGKSDNERAYGSLLLSLASNLTPTELCDRVHPEVLGSLIESHTSERLYMDRFAAHVKRSLVPSENRGIKQPLLTRVRGWSQLVGDRPEELQAWLRPFSAQLTAHPMFLMYRFPFRDALAALGTIDPEMAAQIIERQIDKQRGSAMRIEEVWNVAMRVPGEPGDRLREVVLDAANNDEKLFAVVDRAYCGNNEAWLYRAIERDLEDVSSGIVARAITLAGFLNADALANSLWERITATSATGWLADVQSVSYARFLRHQWSMHWRDRYIAALDEEAFAAHELLVATIDARMYRERRPPTRELFDSWSWRKQLHWLASADARKAAVEKVARGRKDVLFGQRMPHEAQSPRLQ
jgi:hypothetical protein